MPEITKRPLVVDEVIIKKIQVVSGNIDISRDGFTLGTVVTTKDGGSKWNIQDKPIFTTGTYSQDDEVFHNGSIWISLEDNNQTEPKDDAIKWQEVEKFDANGILLENVTETGSVAVLITGEVREKYLEHYDSSMKKALFKNKIILR